MPTDPSAKVFYRGVQISLRDTQAQQGWRIFFPATGFPDIQHQREYMRQFGTGKQRGTPEKKAAAYLAALKCIEEKLGGAEGGA